MARHDQDDDSNEEHRLMSADDLLAPPVSGPRAPLPADALDAFSAVVRERRSVRRFRTDPLPDGVLDRILEAGLWAPSPHGAQPWRYAVVTRAETKACLADAMAADWRHNLEMDGQPDDVITARLDGSRRRLLEAPAHVIVCLYAVELDRYPDPERAAAERIMAIQSLGACAQTMLLTAYALGVDAGWMCAPLFCPEVVVETLGLDPLLTPHGLLAIGHAAADPRRRPRRPLATLVAFDDRARR